MAQGLEVCPHHFKMALTIGRNTNTNDTAFVGGGITLNSSTTTTISTADANRIFFAVSTDSSLAFWLKLQAASVDDDKDGLFMPACAYWEMPTDNVYTGEISAIADSGSPKVYVTEY